VNRDVSAASKKVIFLLQRILNETSNDDHVLHLRAATEAKKKLAEVHAMLRNITHELDGSRFWRYAHNISGGLQEYIEALSFVHYIEYGGFVSYEQVQANLCRDISEPVGRALASFHRTVDDTSSRFSCFHCRCRTMSLERVTLPES
jgi:predicted translin family RNA/ssDNA-binding protein